MINKKKAKIIIILLALITAFISGYFYGLSLPRLKMNTNKQYQLPKY